MKLFLFIALIILTSCATNNPIISNPVVTESICLENNNNERGSGFRSNGWIYTVNHLYPVIGERQRIGHDAVREPDNGQYNEFNNIPVFSEYPLVGDKIYVVPCLDFGQVIESEITVIIENGLIYGYPNQTIALIPWKENHVPLGYSGSPILNNANEWIGIMSAYDETTNNVIVVIPNQNLL